MLPDAAAYALHQGSQIVLPRQDSVMRLRVLYVTQKLEHETDRLGAMFCASLRVDVTRNLNG